jgi:hypothetical protein
MNLRQLMMSRALRGNVMKQQKAEYDYRGNPRLATFGSFNTDKDPNESKFYKNGTHAPNESLTSY